MAEQFTLHVPPFQGEEICLGTFAWGCARRASPQAATWRAFSPRRPIVSELDALQAEVAALKHLQPETATEWDAWLPAILDGSGSIRWPGGWQANRIIRMHTFLLTRHLQRGIQSCVCR